MFNISKINKTMEYTYKEFQDALKIVNKYKYQMEEHYRDIAKQCKGVSRFVNITKETKLNMTRM